MSSNRHHRHRRQGGTTPTTEPQNSPGVAQFSVSEVAQFSVSLDKAIEDWPWLDQGILRSSRSRQVCMTCHFFRHHPGPACIPLLTCHLHQGLIAHGEQLTRRCSNWTENQHRQRGWAPEVA